MFIGSAIMYVVLPCLSSPTQCTEPHGIANSHCDATAEDELSFMASHIQIHTHYVYTYTHESFHLLHSDEGIATAMYLYT